MTDFIRRLVSGPKARFQDQELGLDLDLVYVTDRIIIMGYPAAGLEGLYRNRREDAKRFLDHRHGKNYWVFNFCPIKENSYGADVFEGRVTRYPFPDHHAPPLAILPLVSREMHEWLDASPEHVAVLHCKAGKGRSGTMACTYLVTLDTPPTAPSHNRSLSASDRANLHIDETIKELPEDDHHLAQPAPTTPRPGAILSADSRRKSVSDTVGITGELVASPPPESPLDSPLHSAANPERSFLDSLKGVLDLHTARRMKPANDPRNPSPTPKKQRKGVSIPSQRRWLYYWALLLSGDAPRDVFNHSRNLDSLTATRSEKPRVRVTRIQIRMREGGVAGGIVRATNIVIDKASSLSSKKASSGSASSDASGSSAPVEKAVKEDPNQVWASIARYDDELIDHLEAWEAWTRDDANISKRRKESKTMKAGDTQHELDNLFDPSGKWDANKMVHSFSRFGLRGTKDQTVTLEEETKEKIYTYTLRLLTDKRWSNLKSEVAAILPTVTVSSSADTEGGLSAATSNPEVKKLEKDMQQLDIPRSEANSIYDDTSVKREETNGHTAEELDGLIVDASRELRVKLYVGKVFIGWFWFIPTFHMPQPPPTGSASPESTTTTFHLTRKDLDFALGLGSAIIDVDVDMEWVPQPSTPEAALDEALPVNAGNKVDSLEAAESKGVLGSVIQATSGSGGLSDAVKVGQAGDV